MVIDLIFFRPLSVRSTDFDDRSVDVFWRSLIPFSICYLHIVSNGTDICFKRIVINITIMIIYDL